MLNKYKYLESENRITLNLWFIKLRWIAIVISFILILLSATVHKFIDKESLVPLLSVNFLLIVSNFVYKTFISKKIFIKYIEKIQIFFDLLFLSIFLQFSGGIENPLSFIYILHVILSGILLSKKDCYKVVFIATFFYAFVSLSELLNIFPHYTLLIYPHSTEDKKEIVTYDSERNGHVIYQQNLSHVALYPLYVWSMIILNFFLMLLTAYFITTIMERLRNEERETHEKYQWLERVLQATGAGLLILNKDFTSEWMNEPIKKWLKIKGVSTSNENIRISEWTKDKHNEVSKTFTDGITRTIELEKFLETGQKQFFQITIAPMFNPSGEIYQIVELVQDITEKKILEAEMLHSSKMATVGTMAASIAHEVGNPLSSISTRLKLLESKKDVVYFKESIPLLQREIERIKRIVRGISHFGKPEKETWGVCNINSLLKETVEMLKYHKTSRKCRIILNLDKSLPPTLASHDQMKQVFLNLGLNAFEAMKDGGDLNIKTYYRDGNIIIKFEDTGEGMKQKILEQIFTPFFSTKEQGSGLGLFIVYHIIQAHGGDIKSFSEIGKGSSFIIYLPIQLHSKKAE